MDSTEDENTRLHVEGLSNRVKLLRKTQMPTKMLGSAIWASVLLPLLLLKLNKLNVATGPTLAWA